MQDNNKKIALISGANRGLGFEISKQLAHQGIRVIIGARDSIKGQEAAHILKQQGLDAYSCVLDVNDAESICKAVNWIQEQFGTLHILVNNAGVILDRSTSVLDLNADTLSQTLQPNLIGPFLLCQTCIPLMKKANYGRIVNVSSLLGSLTDMNDANSPFSRVMAPAYRMSKTALNALTTLFAKELQGTNILINSAHPGWLQTDMGSKAADLSVDEGAATPVWLATLPDGGPNGGFFHRRYRLAW